MWIKLIIGDKTARLTKEEYLKIINDKPDEEFLKECKEVVKLFKGDGDNEHSRINRINIRR